MPITREELTAQGATLAVWRITETEKQLRQMFAGDVEHQDDTTEVDAYKVARKRKQWFASRILSSKVIPDFQGIYYDQFGAPHLKESDKCISYSHSYDRIALLCHPEHELGLDVQIRDEKLTRIASKFLNEEEAERHNQHSKPLDYLQILWSAKESIFKVHKHSLPFKQIRTAEFDLSDKGILEIEAHRFDGVHPHRLHYELNGDFYLAYTVYEEG